MGKKKITLLLASIIIALIVLPAGTASWRGHLSIDGEIATGEINIEELKQADNLEVLEEAEETEPAECIDEQTEEKNNCLYEDSTPGSKQPPKKYGLNIVVIGEGITKPVHGLHYYNEGSEVQLTATSAVEWEFVEWVVGADKHEDNTIPVVIDDNIKVVALFRNVNCNLDCDDKNKNISSDSDILYDQENGNCKDLINDKKANEAEGDTAKENSDK